MRCGVSFPWGFLLPLPPPPRSVCSRRPRRDATYLRRAESGGQASLVLSVGKRQFDKPLVMECFYALHGSPISLSPRACPSPQMKARGVINPNPQASIWPFTLVVLLLSWIVKPQCSYVILNGPHENFAAYLLCRTEVWAFLDGTVQMFPHFRLNPLVSKHYPSFAFATQL